MQSPEQWGASLWNGVLTQCLVIDPQAKEWVGIASCYNADQRHGHAYLAAAKFNMADASRRMLEGVVLFIDYVLSTWQFRKLYMDVPAFNLDQIGSGIGRLLEEEGRLKDHLWLNGQFWDLHLLAITRGRWEERRADLVGLATGTLRTG